MPAYSLASSFSQPFSSQYDSQIKAAAKRYLPGIPWQLYKAQLYAESALDTCAVSPVGAQGLAQFMPDTWAQISRELKLGEASPRMAAPAIDAGAYYMASLRLQWSAPRPEYDRHSLALASYNAGLGSLLKAQKRCNMASLYPDISACLPQVTGRHAQETLTYVPKIWDTYRRMALERNP